MRGVLSLSASVVMMGITMMTVADVQPDQEEIQQVEIVQEAAVKPQEIEAPEARVMARTHDVHVYTQEDADLIKRIALAEGETEGPDGMWLIMSVIVNRVNDPDFQTQSMMSSTRNTVLVVYGMGTLQRQQSHQMSVRRHLQG